MTDSNPETLEFDELQTKQLALHLLGSDADPNDDMALFEAGAPESYAVAMSMRPGMDLSELLVALLGVVSRLELRQNLEEARQNGKITREQLEAMDVTIPTSWLDTLESSGS